ncbi:glycosyltransferase involved in cell wall biosynthesis [Flavobacteriaceae bacterium MAR_2010_72]|nr:glycosyltransferase involved in cell wall biosynthesis [Flavobacteriaceae bacterium MAR_2010_72]TVZ59004.1 glycosyltransferase involved in cell wall biosynthesis [Flavobacteriaceae bacterium MAR_2010_105]
MPFFSVVITLYNKENHIYNTLNSVLRQSFKDFEVIIINDGSTDDSPNIVRAISDNRIQLIDKKNEGVSVARNLGIKVSKSNYTAFLDADDIWMPDHLKNLKELIEHFPNCGLYCTAYETFFYNKKVVKGVYSGINHDFFGVVPNYFENSLVDGIALTSAVGIPKQIFDRHGYFNVDLRSGQDTELWTKIALKESVAFTSKVTMRRVIGDSDYHLSKSDKRTDKIALLEHFKIYEKNNPSLKRYMDNNRYSIALDQKMVGDIDNFKRIRQGINSTNLNKKQRILLKLPGSTLNFLKKIQVFLIKKNMYLSAFRKGVN